MQFQALPPKSSVPTRSVSELRADLSSIHASALKGNPLSAGHKYGMQLGKVLEIASDLAHHILSEKQEERRPWRWFFDSIISRPSRSEEDLQRFIRNSQPHIEAFRKLSDWKSNRPVDDRFEAEGIDLSTAALPKESLDPKNPIPVIYSMFGLYDFSLELINAVEATSTFLGSFDRSPSPELLALFGIKSTHAASVFESALREARIILDCVPTGLFLFLLCMPEFAAGFSKDDTVDSENITEPSKRTFTPDEEEMKVLREMSDEELVANIRETAERLEDADQILGQESAALLLSEDLELAGFREQISAFRFCLGNVKSSAALLTTPHDCSSAGDGSQLYKSFGSFVQTQRYATSVNLTAYLSTMLLEDTYRNLESKKNLLHVTNPARDEVQRSLDAFSSGLVACADTFTKLHTRVFVLQERALLQGMIGAIAD